ncbi:MAG: hypothetical protein GY755_24305 [Chloroflexi bacterium]|nr:hypothetical protein [Chloroflexota bacterium]
MAKNALKLGAPPPRKTANDTKKANIEHQPVKFANLADNDKVQFNKRVTRATADGFEMLAIKTRRKVPELLSEAIELLQEKYGKV